MTDQFRPGDRVLVLKIERDGTPATLLAVPCDVTKTPGLAWLDSPIGHSGSLAVTELLHDVRNTQHDESLIREMWKRRSENKFWFVQFTEIVHLPPPATGHVPGLWHCAGGCGMTNQHVDASSFTRPGRYVCYMCRSWGRL